MTHTRRAVIRSGLALAAASPFDWLRTLWRSGRSETPPLQFAGVNLAGAEFGTVPGHHTIDYMYPSSSHAGYFADRGFTCLRIPFRWERLQPDLFGEFADGERALLENLVRTITDRGLVAIIDPHNFAKRRLLSDNWSSEHLIGSPSVPSEAFADFWRRLALLFKRDDRVVFGLMNEPAGISAPDWLDAANRATAAIRMTGAANLILVPGTAYSGAHSWLSSGNTILAGFKDPHHHFAIEVHQYFDADSSGTSPTAVSGSCGSERLQDFQAWAREHGLKAFLGEFGAADNPASLNALADLCQEMSANPGIWIGWTAWAAGPFWPPDYMFNLDPAPGGGERRQTRLLASYARPSSQDYWVRHGAAVDLDLARGRIHGCSDVAEALSFAMPHIAHKGQPGPLHVRGPLLNLLREPAFTLLVETRDLDAAAGVCEIVSAEGRPILFRSANGALGTAWAEGAATAPCSLEAWRTRRRCALSVQRSPARISIGATGCGSLSISAPAPALEGQAVTAGGTAGSVVRITGYAGYMEGSALDDTLA